MAQCVYMFMLIASLESVDICIFLLPGVTGTIGETPPFDQSKRLRTADYAAPPYAPSAFAPPPPNSWVPQRLNLVFPG